MDNEAHSNAITTSLVVSIFAPEMTFVISPAGFYIYPNDFLYIPGGIFGERFFLLIHKLMSKNKGI